MSVGDDSYPFPGVECQHRIPVLIRAVQNGAAGGIGAPSPARVNPQGYLQLIVGELCPGSSGWRSDKCGENGTVIGSDPVFSTVTSNRGLSSTL